MSGLMMEQVHPQNRAQTAAYYRKHEQVRLGYPVRPLLGASLIDTHCRKPGYIHHDQIQNHQRYHSHRIIYLSILSLSCLGECPHRQYVQLSQPGTHALSQAPLLPACHSRRPQAQAPWSAPQSHHCHICC